MSSSLSLSLLRRLEKIAFDDQQLSSSSHSVDNNYQVNAKRKLARATTDETNSEENRKHRITTEQEKERSRSFVERTYGNRLAMRSICCTCAFLSPKRSIILFTCVILIRSTIKEGNRERASERKRNKRKRNTHVKS